MTTLRRAAMGMRNRPAGSAEARRAPRHARIRGERVWRGVRSFLVDARFAITLGLSSEAAFCAALYAIGEGALDLRDGVQHVLLALAGYGTSLVLGHAGAAHVARGHEPAGLVPTRAEGPRRPTPASSESG